MVPRLIELERVLRQTGGLYLHCEPPPPPIILRRMSGGSLTPVEAIPSQTQVSFRKPSVETAKKNNPRTKSAVEVINASHEAFDIIERIEIMVLLLCLEDPAARVNQCWTMASWFLSALAPESSGYRYVPRFSEGLSCSVVMSADI